MVNKDLRILKDDDVKFKNFDRRINFCRFWSILVPGYNRKQNLEESYMCWW